MQTDWSIEGLSDPEYVAFLLKRHAAIVARMKIKPPKGYAVMHINGDPYDNSLENLVVVSKKGEIND